MAPVYLDAARDPLGPGAILVRVVGFALGMAAVLSLCRAVAEPPGGGIITAKAEAFRRTSEEYDTVFLGTSRTYRWFIPSDFDAEMAKVGVPTSSFNMGVPGASFFELHYVLRDCIERAPNLKRVLFEYQELMPQIDPLNSYKPRMVYWHDAAETALAMETAVRLRGRRDAGRGYVEDPRSAHALTGVAFRTWPDDWRIAYEHLKHGLTRTFMVGRGKDVTRGLVGRDKPELAPMIGNRGYLSLEAEQLRFERMGLFENQYSFRRDKFLAEVDEYLDHVVEMKGEAPVFGDTDWYNGELGLVRDVEILRRVVEDAHEAGVEFVLVVMPGLSRDRAFTRRLMAELDAPVLVYNAPETYPEFYDPSAHFDTGHPAASGAERFTRQLVRDLREAGVR